MPTIETYITSSGLHVPPNRISNDELVEAYNKYADIQNDKNKDAIAKGEMEPLPYSSSEFIAKASGIMNRFAVNKSGLIDPERLRPHIPDRPNDQPCVQAELAIAACKQAMERADISPKSIDGLILACSDIMRGYPAVAIEVQKYLEIDGFAFDMNVACSSATFAMQIARDMIQNGSAKNIMIVNPEICTGHLDFKDRDCHFIFGDASTAFIVSSNPKLCDDGGAFRILSSSIYSDFSNNIRNNFGYLSPCDEKNMWNPDKLFKQNGRRVFKEVVPMVVKHIQTELDKANQDPKEIKKYWLHQANINMNQLICKKINGGDVDSNLVPSVLDEYANTSSAGCMIAFHLTKNDIASKEKGIICSFGAGYSIGTVIVEKQ